MRRQVNLDRHLRGHEDCDCAVAQDAARIDAQGSG